MALMLRELGPALCRAQPRRLLSRPARQPGQPARQPRAADAALPARGARGGDRAWLRQGDRQADGRDRPQQCRADARDDGDLQRLVRPRAGVRARRHRPGRRGQAAAVDRLDPHRARPGRAGPQLHQMGRPAGLGRGGRRSRCCAPTGWRRRRRCGPVYVCLDAALQESRIGDLPPLPERRRASARRAPPRPIRRRSPRPPRCSQAPSGR